MSNFANLTPFAAAQVTNSILKTYAENDERFVDVSIRPQMLYSYARKGTIASNYETRGDNEKVEFEGAAFKAWLDRYVERIKNGTANSNVDYDALAKQYM
jgi:hypothetical protein